MVEHIGIVIKTESRGFAQVVTDRKGACGGCQSTSDRCRSCLAGAKMESRVANPIGAEPGDLVKVHLSSEKFFAGAAILYLLPVLGLLIGAFTGAWVVAMHEFSEISGSISGALAGLGVGYAAVMAVDRSPRIRQQIIPTITAIVKPKACIENSKRAPCDG